MSHRAADEMERRRFVVNPAPPCVFISARHCSGVHSSFIGKSGTVDVGGPWSHKSTAQSGMHLWRECLPGSESLGSVSSSWVVSVPVSLSLDCVQIASTPCF